MKWLKKAAVLFLSLVILLSGIRMGGTKVQAAGTFNLKNGTVRLNNGEKMPVLGIGTYTLSNNEAENSVYWALRDGYRLIDTARIYGNETGVGRGIKRAIDEGIVKKRIFLSRQRCGRMITTMGPVLSTVPCGDWGWITSTL